MAGILTSSLPDAGAYQELEEAWPEACEEQHDYHRLLFDATNEALSAANDKVSWQSIFPGLS